MGQEMGMLVPTHMRDGTKIYFSFSFPILIRMGWEFPTILKAQATYLIWQMIDLIRKMSQHIVSKALALFI